MTWNVNSLRARLPRVLEFLAEFQPDIACLQETKSAPDTFPLAELAERLLSCGMVRNYRKGKKPSDHAPLLLELE